MHQQLVSHPAGLKLQRLSLLKDHVWRTTAHLLSIWTEGLLGGATFNAPPLDDCRSLLRHAGLFTGPRTCKHLTVFMEDEMIPKRQGTHEELFQCCLCSFCMNTLVPPQFLTSCEGQNQVWKTNKNKRGQVRTLCDCRRPPGNSNKLWKQRSDYL